MNCIKLHLQNITLSPMVMVTYTEMYQPNNCGAAQPRSTPPIALCNTVHTVAPVSPVCVVWIWIEFDRIWPTDWVIWQPYEYAKTHSCPMRWGYYCTYCNSVEAAFCYLFTAEEVEGWLYRLMSVCVSVYVCVCVYPFPAVQGTTVTIYK